MLRWVVYLCVAVMLIALITAPTEREFNSFVYASVDTSRCKPVVQYKSYHLMYLDFFSINKLRTCYSDSKQLPEETGHAINKSLPPVTENRYLGMFGTFWKL